SSRRAASCSRRSGGRAVSSAEEVMGSIVADGGPRAGSRRACPHRDSDPDCADFKSAASADWAMGAWRSARARAAPPREPPRLDRIVTAVIRSLAASLRRFGVDRLEALLVARPDLASPLPRGIGPLAARAAGATSARRALEALTLPELHLVEAL